MLRGELAQLRAEIEGERNYRAALAASLASRVDTLTITVDNPNATPTVAAARTGLSLTGFVQSDLQLRQSSQDQLDAAGVPLNQETFQIRRARLKAVVERDWVAGALELDGNTVNGPQVRILNAEASLKWPPARGGIPLVMATIGAFKIPFGYEVGTQSDRERLFMERSTASRALFPGEYDIGVRLMGGWRFVRYALAVQNGNPIGDRAFAFRDPNSAKDVTGRIGVDTPIVDTVWIAGGFSGLTGKGFHAGTSATKPVVQWSDSNGDGAFNQGELVVVPGTAAVPSRTTAGSVSAATCGSDSSSPRSERRSSTASSTGPRTWIATSSPPTRSASGATTASSASTRDSPRSWERTRRWAPATTSTTPTPTPRTR